MADTDILGMADYQYKADIFNKKKKRKKKGKWHVIQ